jgi:DNA-binding transcriptional regulator PaaX
MENLFNFYKPRTVFQWLIFLAAIGFSLSSPAGTRKFFRELNKYLEKNSRRKNKFFNPQKLSQALYYLKKRKLIEIKEKGGKTIVLLTEKGKKRKFQYDLNNMEIPKPKNWDKKWQLLMFDIPENKKFVREALRNKLKDLGFLQFQKSVWIYPYSCENEIDFITEYFSIGPYLNLLTVKIIDDKPLREHFGL